MIRIVLFLVLTATGIAAQEAETPSPINEPPMTYERLGKILFALDPEAQPHGPGFELMISETRVFVVTDTNADRMRVMVPIRSADGLSQADMQRMMQANFDTALDARYAIANGRVWAVFLHPLLSLERDQLISGIAQTVNIALTYGTLYSSGGAQFGGGDSGELQQELFKELLKKGEEI